MTELKPVYILGISAYYHDAAAVLLRDGRIVAALQEERFTRIKHDHSFPAKAIQHCLEIAGITIQEVNEVVFYEKPFWKFERILDAITAKVPLSFSHFVKAIPLWVKHRLWIGAEIRKKCKFKKKVLFASHHESHAAAGFFESGFENAAILTLDGVGEYTSTAMAIGENHTIQFLKEQHFPHSLGLLYSAFTQYCGFKVNSGEYKLMGLAPYGKPVHKQKIYDHFIQTHEDGSYRLDLKYFNYMEGWTMINSHFEKVLGRPARKPESDMDDFYRDVAASVQEVLEEVVLHLLQHVKKHTQKNRLVLSGGVALNCKLNQKIVESGLFEQYFFHANPGDAGSAAGAALSVWHQYLKNENNGVAQSLYSGTGYSNEQWSSVLNDLRVPYQTNEHLFDVVAAELANGKIVGWFNGRMEFGPRALGNRSILADPRNVKMKDVLNEKIKLRERFRPFAPVILSDRVKEFFDLYPCNYDSMMVTSRATEKALALMPAVIHEDGTARIQVVSVDTNPELYALLKAFESTTGCPALINTSFNVRGEPMVESPTDALRCFLHTDMDILVINGKKIVRKEFEMETIKRQLPQLRYVAD